MYQHSLKEKTRQMKSMAAELNMLQAQVLLPLPPLLLPWLCVVRGAHVVTSSADALGALLFRAMNH